MTETTKKDFHKIAVGRRKRSIARVKITPGEGSIIINKKPIEQYFGREAFKFFLTRPFQATDTENKYDVLVNVRGGGLSGQAGAIQLGIARALVFEDEEFRAKLKPLGLLTRDSRVVERKKYGQKKARKRFQFSKR